MDFTSISGNSVGGSSNPATGAYNPSNALDPYGTGGDAAALAQNTAASNLNAGGDIATLTELINKINAGQQQYLNQSRLGPQGQQIQDQLLANTQAGAAGNLTPSEQRTLQQSVAEHWGGQGMGVDSAQGVADYTNRYLRTQYQRQQDAQGNYNQLLADNPSAPLYDAGNSVVTPGQYSSTAQAQANRQLAEHQQAQQAFEFQQRMQLEWAALNNQNRGLGGQGGNRNSGGQGGNQSQPSNNSNNYGGLGPPYPNQPTQPDTYSPDSWKPSDYNAGGSSVFGTGAGGVDLAYDPFWGTAAQTPTYGSMPDYSTGAYSGGLQYDPMGHIPWTYDQSTMSGLQGDTPYYDLGNNQTYDFGLGE